MECGQVSCWSLLLLVMATVTFAGKLSTSSSGQVRELPPLSSAQQQLQFYFPWPRAEERSRARREHRQRIQSPYAFASSSRSFMSDLKSHSLPSQTVGDNSHASNSEPDKDGGSISFGSEMTTASPLSDLEALLDVIDEVSRNLHCSSDYPINSALANVNGQASHQRNVDSHYVFLPKELIKSHQIPGLATQTKLQATSNRIDLLSSILPDYSPEGDHFKLLRNSIDELARLDDNVFRVRLAWIQESIASSASSSSADKGHRLQAQYLAFLEQKKRLFTESYNRTISLDSPWLQLSRTPATSKKVQIMERLLREGTVRVPAANSNYNPKDEMTFAQWTPAYFSCELKMWLFSYTALLVSDGPDSTINLKGVVSVDVDVSRLDFNQCDREDGSEAIGTSIPLLGTHKCHKETSQCIFRGSGWRKGGYICRCQDGFYSAADGLATASKPSALGFNGSLVEIAWDQKIKHKGLAYDVMYTCKRCAEGCLTCTDGSPCLSSYNWAFRISLLTISILCVLLTFIIACYVYKFRKLKVFKVASPVFLCITLLGCAIMYLEMAAIFPVLDVFSCVLTKWTRHMGFCITYSALLLKTWRVSLTYRVKSAHKLKLTDKQLLQWLFPILLVMAIYLGTWTVSSPPTGQDIKDWRGLRFKICEYNWWDHSLVIGELLFLLWGVKVCYSVRNAESFFNEAKYITYAIYNIAVTNFVMIFIHLVILPNAGPDIKYVFGFIRTQFSTSTTVGLIFLPKFYRVLKGQGDSWDNRSRARGVNASFSLNGVGLVHEETTDLYQENEELKEEIHKLATQIELMKLLHMEMNNRHLKGRHHVCHVPTGGSGNSPPTVTITTNPASGAATVVGSSPLVKAIYSRFEPSDGPMPRISPAAELVSERV